MNTENIITLWYFMFFFGFIFITYRALMAIDYSKLFKYNSTWQIKTIVLFISIIIAFLLAYAFAYSYERLIGVFI